MDKMHKMDKRFVHIVCDLHVQYKNKTTSYFDNIP